MISNKNEILEIDKQDIEVVIQQLHFTTDRLENIKNNSTDLLSQEKLNSFIKEMNKEIEFNEDILNEINDGIKFNEARLK